MPTTEDVDSYDMNFYCLTAYVEMGPIIPKLGLKLRPSSSDGRNITDRITVDDGKIYGGGNS